MKRFFSTFLLIAALAVASTHATATAIDEAQLAARIKAVKAELNLLESIQTFEHTIQQQAAVAVTGLSDGNPLAVSAFATGSKASGSKASGSTNDDFDIQPIPTAAPAATSKPTATTTSSKPTPTPATAGSTSAPSDVTTPAPTTDSAAASSTTFVSAAAAVASIAISALL